MSGPDDWRPIEGPPMNSILDSTRRINIWGGPVRSGKTVHSLMRWLEFILIAPKGDLWMIGRTSGSLERNILAPLKEFTGGRFSYSFSQNKAWFAGREIYIIGASNKDAEGRIRGSTAAGAYGDEATLWPAEVFKQLGLRMSVKGAKAFYTTNPDGPYHWLKTDYIDKRKSRGNPNGLDVAYFEWPISANTTLDPEYVANLEKEYSGLWYKRFIQGLWVAAEGAIYDFWDESLHVIDEAPEADEYWLSFDYGTSNATAGGLFGKRYAFEGELKAWMEREYYYSGRETGKQKTDAQYADDIERWLGTDRAKIRGVILDPSAASFKAELRQRGFSVIDADNDVLNGIRRQASMLTTGEYAVHRSCVHTIKDYGAYLWDSRATKRGEDKPLKENDHTKDAERYFLLTQFPVEGSSFGAVSDSAW